MTPDLTLFAASGLSLPQQKSLQTDWCREFIFFFAKKVWASRHILDSPPRRQRIRLRSILCNMPRVFSVWNFNRETVQPRLQDPAGIHWLVSGFVCFLFRFAVVLFLKTSFGTKVISLSKCAPVSALGLSCVCLRKRSPCKMSTWYDSLFGKTTLPGLACGFHGC